MIECTLFRSKFESMCLSFAIEMMIGGTYSIDVDMVSFV